MRSRLLLCSLVPLLVAVTSAAPPRNEERLFKDPINVNPKHISTDKSVKYDYDIVYGRARRAGGRVHKRFYTDIAAPIHLEAGADLVLLHPDGKEELLVEGGEGAITDPVITCDGESVLYVKIQSMKQSNQFQPGHLDYDPTKPQARSFGWMCDDNRPILTLAYPTLGTNPPLSRILVGMHDYYSGLDANSFSVVADVDLDGVKAGAELAGRFKQLSQGVWEMKLAEPVKRLTRGTLTVSVKDRQGNVSRIERSFSVSPDATKR